LLHERAEEVAVRRDVDVAVLAELERVEALDPSASLVAVSSGERRAEPPGVRHAAEPGSLLNSSG
jgi:hypothetical protein